MFLGAHHFDGDTRLVAQFPPGVDDLDVCVARDDGMAVFDACPSSDAFVGFSQSPDFRAALEAAGLPIPRVEPLGPVHAATLQHPVTP